MIAIDQHNDPTADDLSCRTVAERSFAACQLVESGDFSRLASDHNPDTILVIDPDGIVRYASGAVESLVGLGSCDAVGLSIWDFVHPADLESAAGAFNEASRNDGYHMPTELRVRGRCGEWVNSEMTGTTFSGPAGTWLIVTIRVIAHRNEVIRRREEIETVVRDASTVLSGLSWTEVDEVVSEFCRRLASIVGADSFSLAWVDGGELRYGASWPNWVRDVQGGQFAGLWSSDLLHGSLMQFSDDLPSLARSRVRDLMIIEGVRAAVEIPLSGEPLSGVARLTFRRSAERWDDANVDLVKVLATAIMSTVRRCRVERTLQDRASTDPLTGLMNRSELYRHLDELSGADATDGRLAVLFGDLNNFKTVNDVLGHAAGDDLLVAVADVLRRSVRAVDVIARLGGDEFVIVCPDIEDTDQVDTIARRITAAVERIDTGVVPVSMSIGRVVARPGESGPHLLQRADRSMYEAKNSRPDRRRPMSSGPSVIVAGDQRRSLS